MIESAAFIRLMLFPYFSSRETLRLAQELKDRVVEAQACYSLGNTYTLLRDYPLAIEYHTRHLRIAQELTDKVGESRAYWSLGNALTATGKHRDALSYALKHLQLAKEIGDSVGENSAQSTVADLQKLIESNSQPESTMGGDAKNRMLTPKRNKKRPSMDNMELLKMTPNLRDQHDEVASSNFHVNLLADKENHLKKPIRKQSVPVTGSDDDFADLDFLDSLVNFQAERMNDQRATFETSGSIGEPQREVAPSKCSNMLSDKDNRVKRNIQKQKSIPMFGTDDQVADPDFLDLLANFQAKRMDDQRATFKMPNISEQQDEASSSNYHVNLLADKENQPKREIRKQSIPVNESEDQDADLDFLDLLAKFQAERMDDQRATLQKDI